MSSNRNCSAIENELALFVGGDLGPRARAEIEQHLAHCETCTRAVERLALSRAALRAGYETREEQVPELWQGVRARLVESGTLGARPAAAASAAPAPLRRVPRWLPLSAAAAALFALGLWLLQPEATTPVARPLPVEPVANGVHKPVAPVGGLRRLGTDESALSSSASSIEELQEEARLRAALQPGGAQAASQRRGIH